MLLDPPITDRYYARAFTLVTIALLAVVLWQVVHPFRGPLLWAALLAFLLHPLQMRLVRSWHGRRNLAAGLLTAATAALLIGPITGLAAAFVSQASGLIDWLQAMLQQEPDQQSRILTQLPYMRPLLAWLDSGLGIPVSQVEAWLAEAVAAAPDLLAGLGGRVFLGAVNTLLASVVMLVSLFFLVRDGAAMGTLLRPLIPMPPARRDLLLAHVGAVTRAAVFGTSVTVLVQGTLVGMAFVITGLSAPLVFGVLAAVAALIPIGGTALVWAPAVLVLAGQGRPGMAVVMLVIGVLASTIDNVLRPLLISGRAEVGTLAVFIGVLGGALAFGPIGLFLGPVAIALAIALLRFAVEPLPPAP